MTNFSISTKEVTRFFSYATERENIRIKKEQGAPAPWTDDTSLNSFYFCNVFREDDRTTRWFAKNVRRPLDNSPKVLDAVLIWLRFNYIPTGERMLKAGLFENWSPEKARKAIPTSEKMVTGAYMVRTPSGMNKLEGCIHCVNLWLGAAETFKRTWTPNMRLQDMFSDLMSVEWIGGFTAYEMVTDLSHTFYGQEAPDKLSWAHAGPGAIRGLGRLLGGSPDELKGKVPGRQLQEVARQLMYCLLRESWKKEYWPYARPWTMREVEHTLCEYDKYVRSFAGGRMKRTYNRCS